MRESRLTRRSVKQNKKQLYASLIGIVVVLFITINFGPHLIGSLGSLIDSITGKSSQSAKINTNSNLVAPQLDSLPEATPSASITVTGSSYYPDGTIELYVNDSRAQEVDLENDQSFEMEDVRLSEGENVIKARFVLGSKKSDFSEEERIVYAKSPPKLEVSSPTNGQAFSKADQEIAVQGTTSPENKVTVNDFIAIVGSSGNFSYVYKLKEGENKIIVVAKDPAGTQTKTEITVSYSP